jgi:hypothetical protein
VSWRIHTASPAWTIVDVDTVGTLGEEVGYQVDDDADEVVLVFSDEGNQEMWVFTGNKVDWQLLLDRAAKVVTDHVEPMK